MNLYDAAISLSSQAMEGIMQKLYDSAIRDIENQTEKLIQPLRNDSISTEDYIKLLLSKISFMQTKRLISDDVTNLLSIAQESIASLPKESIQACKFLSEFFELSAKEIERQDISQISFAIKLMEKSVENAKKSKEILYNKYLILSDYNKIDQNFSQSLLYIDTALEEINRKPLDFRRDAELCSIYGRKAQICLRIPGKIDDALEAAILGYNHALSDKNLKEQSIFKADQARIYMLKKDFRSAKKSAIIALRTARRSLSVEHELSAYGTLGNVYTISKNWKQAEKVISIGLSKAKEFNQPIRIAAFYMDAAKLSIDNKDTTNFFCNLLNAAKIYTQIGMKGNISDIYYIAFQYIPLELPSDFLLDIIEFRFKMLAFSDSDLSSKIISQTIYELKKNIRTHDNKKLFHETISSSDFIKSYSDNATNFQQQFFYECMILFSYYTEGNISAAIEVAKILDQKSTGIELAKMVENDDLYT